MKLPRNQSVESKIRRVMKNIKEQEPEIFQKLFRNLLEKIVHANKYGLHYFNQLIVIVNCIISAFQNVILHQIWSIDKESIAI